MLDKLINFDEFGIATISSSIQQSQLHRISVTNHLDGDVQLFSLSSKVEPLHHHNLITVNRPEKNTQ